VAGLKGEQPTLPEPVTDQVEIAAKYEGYIKRQEEEIAQLRRHEETKLPQNLDYDAIGGLSNEVKQKLKDVQPASIAQASRIQGVTPAAVSMLLIYLKKHSAIQKTA